MATRALIPTTRGAFHNAPEETPKIIWNFSSQRCVLANANNSSEMTIDIPEHIGDTVN